MNDRPSVRIHPTADVAPDAPVKLCMLSLRNESNETRKLSATAYWEWVLGELRNKTLMHVITELDPISGALFTRNAYNADFPGRVAFVDCSEPIRTVTADRTEFLGRNGIPANPASMRRVRLSGRFGGHDFSHLPLDKPLAPEDFPDPGTVEAARSRTEVIVGLVRSEKPTLRQLLARLACTLRDERFRRIVIGQGKPEEILAAAAAFEAGQKTGG